MSGVRGRYRVVLVEDVGGAMVPYQSPPSYEPPEPPPPSPETLAWGLLLHSMKKLQRRGGGETAWASTVENEPLAFLLGSISDAWLVRDQQGEPLFSNQAAQELSLALRPFVQFERFSAHGREYVRRGRRFEDFYLEIATPV